MVLAIASNKQRGGSLSPQQVLLGVGGVLIRANQKDLVDLLLSMAEYRVLLLEEAHDLLHSASQGTDTMNKQMV